MHMASHHRDFCFSSSCPYPQAVTELSQSAGYDDGKLGHDDGNGK